jgi:hypothetical protein
MGFKKVRVFDFTKTFNDFTKTTSIKELGISRKHLMI